MKNSIRVLAAGFLAVQLAACSGDTTEPAPNGTFEPAQSAGQVDRAEAPFRSDVFNSLSRIGPIFGPSSPGAAGVQDAPVDAEQEKLAVRRELVRVAGDLLSRSAGGSSVVLIPPELAGTTFAYDTTSGSYAPDSTQTGAPANGIRIILYAVNPVTGDIALPPSAIGRVDLLDESTETAGIVRLIVESGGVEFMNYAVSLSGTPLTPEFAIAGQVTDGVTAVEIDMSQSFSSNVGAVTANLDYELEVPLEDFKIGAELELFADGSGREDVTMDVLLSHAADSVTFAGNQQSGTGEILVSVNGQPFAVIAFSPAGVSATRPDGEPLAPEEQQALEQMVNAFENVFNTWDGLFSPVQWLFSGPGGGQA